MKTVHRFIPKVRSPRWDGPFEIPSHLPLAIIDPDKSTLFTSKDGLRLFISLELHEKEEKWLHVSVSRRDRNPSWEDLKEVKDAFIGPDKVAVQVLPRAKDYINIHEFCFHLWHCLDRDVVPNFDSV